MGYVMTAPGPGGLPAPGWCPNPANNSNLRWWDGSGWTEHVRAASQEPATQATAIAGLVLGIVGLILFLWLFATRLQQF